MSDYGESDEESQTRPTKITRRIGEAEQDELAIPFQNVGMTEVEGGGGCEQDTITDYLRSDGNDRLE